MDYDAALRLVGGCGRYQILMFLLLAITCMKVAVDTQLLVIGTIVTGFSCVAPWNATNTTYKTCYKDPKLPNTSCTAFVYDDSLMRRTMGTEFNLVCERAYIVTLYQTLVLVTIGIGRCIGLTSDIFGRRTMFIILLAYDLIITPIQAFVPGLEATFALRMIRALGDGVVFTNFFYITEIVSTKYRMNLGCNFWICYCIGYASAGVLGPIFRDWRYMQVASCFILPAYIAACFIMVESPRWLLVTGKKDQAIKALKKMADWNGKKDVTYEMLEKVHVEEDVKAGRIQDAFSSRAMATKTIVTVVVIWSVNLAYFGLIFDATFAISNVFLNIALMGLIEIPSSPLGWIIGDKLGRRWPCIVLHLLAGASIIIVPHLPQGNLSWIRTTIAIGGKLILATAYCIVAVYLTELQPTCIRNVSMLPTVIVTALGMIVAPGILQLAMTAYWLPSLVLGGWCIIGGLSLLLLPETVNLPLTQTVEEANLLVRGQEKQFQRRLNELRARNDEKPFIPSETVEEKC